MGPTSPLDRAAANWRVDGPVALRSLDLAASAQLVQSANFRDDTVPEIAHSFAKRFSETLSPLFLTSPGPEDWDWFPTWGQADKEWWARLTHTDAMFKTALLMKADSGLNIDDYEAVLYPPGTTFDKDTMIADEGGLHGEAASGRAVSLCLEPALFVHARYDLQEFSCELVETRNALMRREWKYNDQGEITAPPLVRAVVLIL